MAYKFKFKGFSLIEVLMTLMVLSLVLVLMVPIVSKNLSPKKTDGIVYTYGTNMNADEENKCFITTTSYNPNNVNAITTLESTNECSEYEFTVPNGVHSINLTLVAGGGGGGGASGHLYKVIGAEQNNTSKPVYKWYSMSDIKKATIEILAGYGQAGFGATVDGTNCTSGRGGNSSAAIVDYEIPPYMYKKFNLNRLVHERYTNHYGEKDKTSLFVKSDSNKLGVWYGNNNLRIYQGNPDDGSNSITHFLEYGVVSTKNPDPGMGNEQRYLNAEYFCKYKFGDQYYDCGTSYVSSVSEKMPEKYFVPPQEGMPGHTAKCNDPNNNGKYLLGGDGAKINENILQGQGTQGASIIMGDSATGSGTTAQSNNPGATLSLVTKMPDDTSKQYEDKIITGGGGSGGNAVRIIGFKVNPGETYVIRVGKGGKGGEGGKDYIYKEKKDNSIGEQIAGKDATGGTSTSIWKATKNSQGQTTNEDFLFMVVGGVGGEGAYYNASSVNATTEANLRRFGRSAGIQAEFLYGSTIKISDIKFDEKIAVPGDANAEKGPTFNSNKNQPLKYAYLTKEDKLTKVNKPNMPYAALNKLNWSASSFLASRYGQGLASDIKNTDTDYYGAIRGFSWFNHPPFESTGHLQSYEGSVFFEGEEYQLDPSDKTKQINRIYNGFYYRNYIKDNEIGYVGGLGGFSGLGGKAGCGGYFMGNSQGIQVDNNGMTVKGTIDIFKNKFIVRQNNENTAYDVGSYYDNCSIDTPNGQSAKFVMPLPKDLTFGQAGAGGGGGGYSATEGSGNGGNGQNGYLMIDWRK